MWLLDVNLPTALTRLLGPYEIRAEDAAARGWGDLTNGALAHAAFRAGFRVFATRDRRFGVSARTALAVLPDLAVVIVTLPQAREAAYVVTFDAAWRLKPVEPIAGTIIEWPSGPD